ncbi:hypothetical protein CBS101457_005166 [Exobasidium rhododendri]|nr:hypothetical protein CBS101457_005166 [Exobasidium rhododendri]
MLSTVISTSSAPTNDLVLLNSSYKFPASCPNRTLLTDQRFVQEEEDACSMIQRLLDQYQVREDHGQSPLSDHELSTASPATTRSQPAYQWSSTTSHPIPSRPSGPSSIALQSLYNMGVLPDTLPRVDSTASATLLAPEGDQYDPPSVPTIYSESTSTTQPYHHHRSQSWNHFPRSHSHAAHNHSHSHSHSHSTHFGSDNYFGLDSSLNPVPTWLHDSLSASVLCQSTSNSHENSNEASSDTSLGVHPRSWLPSADAAAATPTATTPGTTKPASSSSTPACRTPPKHADSSDWCTPLWRPCGHSSTPSSSFAGSQVYQSPSLGGAQCRITFAITNDIVLRSRNGETKSDIYYPQSAFALQYEGGMTPGLLACSSPPAQDFQTTDMDMRPKQQPEKRRSNDDLYTPLWVRGEGTRREAWCSLCEAGSWMQLKQSAYWYHMRTCHGINTSTGRIFAPPLQLRVHNDNFSTTHGLCSQCRQWQPICTARRKRNFSAWFRHASICHSTAVADVTFGGEANIAGIGSPAALAVPLAPPRVSDVVGAKRERMDSPALSSIASNVGDKSPSYAGTPTAKRARSS